MPSSNISDTVSMNHTAIRLIMLLFSVNVALASLPNVVAERVPKCLAIRLLEKSIITSEVFAKPSQNADEGGTGQLLMPLCDYAHSR